MPTVIPEALSPAAAPPHTIWQTPGGLPPSAPPSLLRGLLGRLRRTGARWRRAWSRRTRCPD